MSASEKRRSGHSKLIVRNGKIVRQCEHRMLAISTHEDFLHKGWLCLDCGEFILKPNTDGYGAAICMFKLRLNEQDGRER